MARMINRISNWEIYYIQNFYIQKYTSIYSKLFYIQYISHTPAYNMGYSCIYQKFPILWDDSSTFPRLSHKNQMIWSQYHIIPWYGIDTLYSRLYHIFPTRIQNIKINISIFFFLIQSFLNFKLIYSFNFNYLYFIKRVKKNILILVIFKFLNSLALKLNNKVFRYLYLLFEIYILFQLLDFQRKEYIF